MKPYLLLACGFITGLLLGCQSKPSVRPPQIVLVSAAASLKETLAKVDPLFEQSHPGLKVNHNFGASGALQQQIEQGAPSDVFISAGKKQLDALQAKGLVVTQTRRNLLTNRLVLIAPKRSILQLKGFQDLVDLRVKKIAVGEPKSVPVGQYTEEVFQNLGILAQLQPKLVFSNSVRSVLAAVESGNVDAGVVYATDAKISGQVRVVATAVESLHSPIVYPVAVLKNSNSIKSAKTYVQFLSSPSAQHIFVDAGFGLAAASITKASGITYYNNAL
jgi:molybdate transport system substrate-binding protein